ncbi:MAG: hypothetical protein ACE361_23600 [Aureliella sp.]
MFGFLRRLFHKQSIDSGLAERSGRFESFETLEPMVLYSGSGLPDGLDVDDAADFEAAETQASTQPQTADPLAPTARVPGFVELPAQVGASNDTQNQVGQTVSGRTSESVPDNPPEAQTATGDPRVPPELAEVSEAELQAILQSRVAEAQEPDSQDREVEQREPLRTQREQFAESPTTNQRQSTPPPSPEVESPASQTSFQSVPGSTQEPEKIQPASPATPRENGLPETPDIASRARNDTPDETQIGTNAIEQKREELSSVSIEPEEVEVAEIPPPVSNSRERKSDGGKDKKSDGGKDKKSDGGKDKKSDGGKDKKSDGGKDKKSDGGKDKKSDGGKDKKSDGGKDKKSDGGKDKKSDGGKDKKSDGGKDKKSDGGKDKKSDGGKDKKSDGGKDE